MLNTDKEFVEFMKKEVALQRATMTPDQMEAFTKLIHLVVAQMMGKNKKLGTTYVLNVKDILNGDKFEDVFMHFAVKVVAAKNKDEDDNVTLSIGYGPYKKAEDEVVEEEDLETSNYAHRFSIALTRDYGYKLGQNWIIILSTAILKGIKNFLETTVENDDINVTIQGYIEYSINKDKVITISADQEIKKRLKSDRMIESTEK